MLARGDVDFYPGFNFTETRSEFVFYFENGMPGGDLGISRKGRPAVTDRSGVGVQGSR